MIGLQVPHYNQLSNCVYAPITFEKINNTFRSDHTTRNEWKEMVDVMRVIIKSAPMEGVSYPMVVMVTIAHQNPSNTPW